MDYSYNYRYLQQYMEEHRLAKKDLLEALGCKDYVSLNKWLDGKIPVHITAMLRFCNYYNVPLVNFFTDNDGLPCDFAPRMPDKNAQLLPTDGYGMKEGIGRGIVKTHISDDERIATSREQQTAVEEGLENRRKQLETRSAAIASAYSDTYDNIPAHENGSTNNARTELEQLKEIHRLTLEHQKKEDDIRKRYDNELERLVLIIEQQAKEISRLSSKLY